MLKASILRQPYIRVARTRPFHMLEVYDVTPEPNFDYDHWHRQSFPGFRRRVEIASADCRKFRSDYLYETIDLLSHEAWGFNQNDSLVIFESTPMNGKTIVDTAFYLAEQGMKVTR